MSINLTSFTEHLSFFYFITFALLFCVVILIVSAFLGGKSLSRYKNVPFESGIASVGNTYFNFSVKFYLIAMFFVIFDVEALYLYAWSVSVRECGWIGFYEALIFVLSLLCALFYLIRIKALD